MLGCVVSSSFVTAQQASIHQTLNTGADSENLFAESDKIDPALGKSPTDFAFQLNATEPLFTLSITPNHIRTGLPTTLIALASVNSPGVSDIALLRLDGQTTTIVGLMHDDGQNGDAIAGDGVFSLAFNKPESAAGTLAFIASAAIPRSLSQLRSATASVTVSSNQMTPAAWAQSLLNSDDGKPPRQAILDLFQTLTIGVYNSSGNTILRGAERSEADFYTYDFEVDLLATALLRGDSVSLADFCTLLNRDSVRAIRRGRSGSSGPAAHLRAWKRSRCSLRFAR
jgi:hypothetical protein